MQELVPVHVHDRSIHPSIINPIHMMFKPNQNHSMGGSDSESESESESLPTQIGIPSSTQFQDLPDVIQTSIFTLITQTRTRNSTSLVCRRWRHLDRTTRTQLTLRGNLRHLFLLPICFPSITHLDLSLLSPYGHLLHPHHLLLLLRAFPKTLHLVLYSRRPSASLWPSLLSLKLVRFHQRPPGPPGSDLAGLLRDCVSISDLDLSEFYCWTEDVPAALSSRSTSSVTSLNLLGVTCSDGFKSSDLIAIATSCPALERFLAPCAFDPRYHDFVGDDALFRVSILCASSLKKLHLVDQSVVSAPRAEAAGGGEESTEAVTAVGLEGVFSNLPLLEDLWFDFGRNVVQSGPTVVVLARKCPKLKFLKLGQFGDVCKATGLHLDGVAVCGGLVSLCLRNCGDLTDAGLVAIGRGCRRLKKFEIQGCGLVSEVGVRKMASMLRSTLVDVGVSCCKHLDAPRVLSALEPIRDRIQRLCFDCDQDGSAAANGVDSAICYDDELDKKEIEEDDDEYGDFDGEYTKDGGDTRRKKGRFSEEFNGDVDGFWFKTWGQLRSLSLWVPVGELLLPLGDIGLESCPQLEEICIKVEGDCRNCPVKPNQEFGLISLLQYPNLRKMKLDCGDVIGYVLTAPKGQMDLSLWERFHLRGIEKLNLLELDYWPPQDRDMNQRSLSLPAVGLLAECMTLRRLFVHGTAHEHFLRFLLNIPNLRDVQFREDYYPAPENDTSTEMRVDSYSRFEDALNSRMIPD